MEVQVGQDALAGKEEYIRGHIFEAEHEDRFITGRGTLIMVIDPNDDDNTKTYQDIDEETTFPVPAGRRVKVLDVLVKMTK